MAVEIRIPELGESIADGVIVRWLKQDGDVVRADEPLLELETDKATVEIPSPAAGSLQIAEGAGATVRVGAVVGRIAEAAAAPAARRQAGARAAAAGAPDGAKRRSDERVTAAAEAAPSAAPEPEAAEDADEPAGGDEPARGARPRPTRPAPEDRATPEVAKLAASRVQAPPEEREEEAEEPEEETGEREEPERPQTPRKPDTTAPTAPSGETTDRTPRTPPSRAETGAVEREPMSRLRRRIAERLVEAQRTAAILTTFNEVDCSRLLDARRRHRERFRERHGVDLGLMSFFARASVLALADVPIVNARIDGDDVVHHRHVHLGIAVSTPRGLVVPVVRDAHRLPFAGLERAIEELAGLARGAKLAPEHLAGGTFTITNGGVFGSLLSTPILNPPQSGILGMHKIEERPVAVDGQVVIRPMMYVALSYDHRLVDGEQAVTFLVRVKERIEDPVRMLLDA